MNFDLTEDQKMLVDSVAAFVKRHSPVTRLRAMREDPIGYSKDILQQMGEFGWLSVAFPESVGGLGGSFLDAALILEQLGMTLVPEPFIPTLIAGTAILRAGSDAQKERYLTPALTGSTTLALAYAEAQSRFNLADVKTRAESSGASYRLYGEKRWVLNGHAADHIVVSARTSGGERDEAGVTLFVLDREMPGLQVTPVKMMDGHHAAMIQLDGVVVDEERRLDSEGGGLAALDEAIDVGAAAACAEGLGIMRTVLAMTTDYLRTREQFGVKIGSFQALQHRAVDMFVETELCTGTSILASLKLGDADVMERRGAVSTAKIQLAIGGRYVTQQSIQLHGGIGVTDEHDVGLYFKRMHTLNTLFGDEEHHLARFASLPSFFAGAPDG
jgi:alkylation response protein AidB-like acyl-CoA dehydrogenase